MVVVMVLTSAACSRKVSEAVLTTASEVTEVTVRERIITDTVVVPGESFYVEVPIPSACDEVLAELLAEQESLRASVKVTKVKATTTSPAKLRIDADCKEYEAEIFRLEKETDSLRTSATSTVSKEVVREPFVPNIYKWAMGFSIVMLVIALIYTIYKIAKVYFKLQLPI